MLMITFKNRLHGTMAKFGSVMKSVTFFTAFLQIALTRTHSLQYVYTGCTPGTSFPEFTAVGLVDGEQFVYYDSDDRKMIPKVEWIRKIGVVDADYWERETQINQEQQVLFQATVPTLMQRFNQSTGVHTLQRMFGCELDDDGNTRGYRQYGYDGEDFINLDIKSGTWTAVKPEAQITKHEWESEKGQWNGKEEPKVWKSHVEKECIEWLQKFVSFGRETLARKVHPEASVFQRHYSSPELVCHATGFFPKSVMITWQKDGEDVHEDVELRETLPNQDGSFQKRSILKVPAEDLRKHIYTCVIQHSSLGEELVLEPPKGGASIGLIVGVIAGLLVLALVVVGIVVWRKKKSAFRAVPSGS